MRSSVTFTILAAAIAASLLTTPRLAAQQSPLRPTVAPTDDGQTDDAGSLRRLVNDEAVHRDRVARMRRLRTLAEQSGRRDRLDDLDRLDRTENERFETRAQLTRRRMGPTAQHEADQLLRKGGVIRLRREAMQTDGRGVQRTGTRSATGTQNAPVRRATTTPAVRRSGGSATRSGSSGSASGGRSPR